jgi:hypothetical protein
MAVLMFGSELHIAHRIVSLPKRVWDDPYAAALYVPRRTYEGITRFPEDDTSRCIRSLKTEVP